MAGWIFRRPPDPVQAAKLTGPLLAQALKSKLPIYVSTTDVLTSASVNIGLINPICLPYENVNDRIFGVTTVSFGSGDGSNEASANVTASTAYSAERVMAWVSADDTSVDHTKNDHKYFALFAKLTTQLTGGGFIINVRSAHKLSGTFTVRYSYSSA